MRKILLVFFILPFWTEKGMGVPDKPKGWWHLHIVNNRIVWISEADQPTDITIESPEFDPESDAVAALVDLRTRMSRR